MKRVIKNIFYLPQEKIYLLWVLLILLIILFIQILIYPKLRKYETYQTLKKSYQIELIEMNNKIAEALIQKAELDKTEKFLDSSFSYNGNIISLIHTRIINKMPLTFKLGKLFSEKHITSGETVLVPIYMDFESNKKDLILFLEKLNSLPVPTEIIDMKIDDLSPSRISVKIQTIFEQRKL